MEDKIANENWKRLCLGLPINDETPPEMAGFYLPLELAQDNKTVAVEFNALEDKNDS